MVGNRNNRIKDGFRSLLLAKFYGAREHKIDSVCEKMGISSHSMYKYLSGERQFPIDRLADLYLATKDKAFLKYILDPCDFDLCKKTKDKAIIKALSHLAMIINTTIDLEEEK